MPVGDEEEALVLILQLHPVAQSAVVVAQMQRAGGAHARKARACLGEQHSSVVVYPRG